jgi:hypothetical protein
MYQPAIGMPSLETTSCPAGGPELSQIRVAAEGSSAVGRPEAS